MPLSNRSRCGRSTWERAHGAVVIKKSLVVRDTVESAYDLASHIFLEIYRVSKPGGWVVLDDVLTPCAQKSQILAKEDIRDDIAQHVGCIGGAIQLDAYRALLHSAGFNIYELRQRANPQRPPAVYFVRTGLRLSLSLDLNQWAASHQIYVRKPVCAAPGATSQQQCWKNWWDAFPAPTPSAIKRISPTAEAVPTSQS
ncbi:hypothetical protein K438DRAFT_1969912 [Mycena galopus ATCC 62051]|nr:hypothetical protein K438DRAFT_1969912 [Mycena galopus ATCC 62051]